VAESDGGDDDSDHDDPRKRAAVSDGSQDFPNGPCGERDQKNGERSAESSDDVEADEDREVQADPESRDPSAVPATCGGDQSDEREGEEEKEIDLSEPKART
jgi:hypothetical protein